MKDDKRRIDSLYIRSLASPLVTSLVNGETELSHERGLIADAKKCVMIRNDFIIHLREHPFPHVDRYRIMDH